VKCLPEVRVSEEISACRETPFGVGCALRKGYASVGSMFLRRLHRGRMHHHDGTKIRSFVPLPDPTLEEHVPKDNFYRRLQATLARLSCVRELVSDCYASSGRPSVDPAKRVYVRMPRVDVIGNAVGIEEGSVY